MVLISRLALAILLGAAVVPVGVACAQNASSSLPTSLKTAKPAKKTATAPAPSRERRPGELEGWNADGRVAPKASNRPADAVGIKPTSADGGLPLPRGEVRDPSVPLGLDPNGHIGPSMKF
jgi:hypothetical protein